MNQNHINKIRNEFRKQADAFNDPQHTIGSHEIMEWIINTIQPLATQTALDVAAGTALLGRALAKTVKKVTAVDATQAMLDVARKAAADECLKNIDFVNADAEKLPFSSNQFDLVVSRLAVHHFSHPKAAISEMCRVCKTTGKLFIIDLISPDDLKLQDRYNNLERMRDPSHGRALTQDELLQTLQDIGESPALRDVKTVEVDFEKWVRLTKTPPETVETIKRILLSETHNSDGDVTGHEKTDETGHEKTDETRDETGFHPHLVEGHLKFYQRWAIVEA